MERWQGLPGPAALQSRPSGCAHIVHPHQAQRAQRAQLVSPDASACVAQALACHPTQPCVASGAAPGYIHLWNFVDASLKATYAPLPYTRSLEDGPSGGVPQPQQVRIASIAVGHTVLQL